VRLIAIGAGLSAVTLVPLACSSAVGNSSGQPADLRTGGQAGAAVAAPAAPPAPSSSAPASPSSSAQSSVPSTPSTAAVTTLAATVAPTTARPTTLAPTTTLAPSPAIVWVGASPTHFVAVGGGGGSDTAAIQQRLLDLGFWLSGPDGEYGLTTSQAVMAFQKYMGLEATGRVNQATADALTSMEWRGHALADAGTLVEINKDSQLLFVVQNGRTVWIFNTSTGNGQPYEEQDQNTPGEVQIGVSITRNGLHSIYRERPEGWWEGDLGKIDRPKYFSGGQAVHGSNNVPAYPASHGCVRVSIPAMDFIWESGIMPIDTPVWVHGVP
jgi:peptidoglycan hydrolase-like protein with peptidoglycan-binding domain